MEEALDLSSDRLLNNNNMMIQARKYVQWRGLLLAVFKTHVPPKLIAFTCVTYA